MAERRSISFAYNHQATVILFPDSDGWLDPDQLAQQLSRGPCPDCPPTNLAPHDDTGA